VCFYQKRGINQTTIATIRYHIGKTRTITPPCINNMKQELLALLRANSLLNGYFILASGKHSTTFLDCKRTLLTAQGHILAANFIWDEIQKLRENTNISTVAAVPIGGCSIASAVSTYSATLKNQPLDALYIRKEVKDHGTNNLIEGIADKNDGVVLLEDVLTTGKSSMIALNALKDNGYNVVAVICIVDRLAGGKETIEKEFGIPVEALFTMKDFE